MLNVGRDALKLFGGLKRLGLPINRGRMPRNIIFELRSNVLQGTVLWRSSSSRCSFVAFQSLPNLTLPLTDQGKSNGLHSRYHSIKHALR